MKAEENPKPAGSLTAEQKLALWRKIQSAHFFDLKDNERGNMTAYMRVTANGGFHEVYWVPRFNQPNTPLQELYMFCAETISHAAQN